MPFLACFVTRMNCEQPQDLSPVSLQPENTLPEEIKTVKSYIGFGIKRMCIPDTRKKQIPNCAVFRLNKDAYDCALCKDGFYLGKSAKDSMMYCYPFYCFGGHASRLAEDECLHTNQCDKTLPEKQRDVKHDVCKHMEERCEPNFIDYHPTSTLKMTCAKCKKGLKDGTCFPASVT